MLPCENCIVFAMCKIKTMEYSNLRTALMSLNCTILESHFWLNYAKYDVPNLDLFYTQANKVFRDKANENTM